MKALIILSLTMVSLNAFSAEVGEDKKGECAASSQTNKREAKVVIEDSTKSVKEETKTAVK